MYPEITVSYQPKFKASERPVIKQSDDAYRILIGNWDLNKIQFQEQLYMLLLNTANKVIGISLISAGGKSGTVADPKIIFSIALKAQASGNILAHSHPSENLNPSKADLQLTSKLVQAGKALDLPILDHLIVTTYNYYSFGDEGLI